MRRRANGTNTGVTRESRSQMSSDNGSVRVSLPGQKSSATAWNFDSIVQNGRSITAFAIAFGCLYASKFVGTLEGWLSLYDADPMLSWCRDNTVP